MTRTFHSGVLGIAILVVIGLLLGAANAWGEHGYCPAQFPKVIGCVISAREGLAGGLFGAGGALFAARIAWAAIQDQIIEAKILATSREREALGAATTILREEFLELFNEVWRAV